MPYSNLADITEQISETELVELTDDIGTGEVDESAVARAVDDADAEINSYCVSRYTVPFAPVPRMIRKLSVDIAIYNLFSRRALDVSDERQQRYDNAIRFLRDLAKGLISLGDDSPPIEPDNSMPQASRAKEDRIFTIGRKSVGGIGTLDNY